jgi:hypothetical protein
MKIGKESWRILWMPAPSRLRKEQTMKANRIWITVIVAAFLTLMAGGAGALPEPSAPEAAVAGRINYQGRLTDPGGIPLTGTFPMRFQVYNDAAAGAVLWDSGVFNTNVDHGLFNVGLDVDPAAFNGQSLWLRMYVNGEWLSPRQELRPVPYALSLRPGAIVEGEPTEWTGHVLQVNMDGAYPEGKAVWGSVATGEAIRGDATGGYGVIGYTEEGYAVYGLDGGSASARGYGGYFDSANGVGVYGHSSATAYYTNMYAPGVYGRSTHGTGVYGVSDGGSPGMRGESAGIGVYGRTQGTSTSDYGVQGQASGLGYGVYGYQSSSATGGLGVYGKNEGSGSGVSGYNGGAGNGTWGYSTDYNGVGGATNRTDSNYGLYTTDNIYSANYHTSGAIMQVVQNSDASSLERGDVVVVAGMGPAPAENAAPVIQVRKASEANSPAVVGVVASSYSPEWLADSSMADPTAAGPGQNIPLSGPGPIAPGDYMLIVVQGPAQVKVSALSGPIQPGSLLSSAGEAGFAAEAAQVTVEGISTPIPGTVFGKALEALNGGQKLIYVFVTLQ